MLKEELLEFRKRKGYLPRVILIHMSPEFESEIRIEGEKIALELGMSITIAIEGNEISI